MSKYIDAEKELKELKNMKVEGEVFTTAVNFAIKVIEDAPSIDIVRCKECIYWIDDRSDENDMGTCWLTHYFTDETDFCSYGERKERE